ncbi:bacteriocin-like protein [Serratia fonticola]|jgi:bacteriocin-like protein|uniref:Bacteriocin-like protein n=1 Tax=Serratia fonticola TaxID=47917 RepID=A0A559T1B2_SERFO|nr:bacteriocin [Serratia fonticola]TQI79109.1 bacteriocin-like protein [Serratia fonticola]TQI98867.1 bacteriocin-like protein [Serratia fonticola]TVZ68393.1 bacteriocin-like protein [Serratia fonticola]
MYVKLHELNEEELNAVSGGAGVLGSVLDFADIVVNKSYDAAETLLDGVQEGAGLIVNSLV